MRLNRTRPVATPPPPRALHVLLPGTTWARLVRLLAARTGVPASRARAALLQAEAAGMVQRVTLPNGKTVAIHLTMPLHAGEPK